MPHGSLSGKVAIVTGAAGGIGAATARRLAAEDVRVVAVDIDSERLAAVVAGLPGGLAEHLAVTGDVASEMDVQNALERAVRRFGRVDLHHLNAGIPGPLTPLPDLSVEDFDRVINVNLRGAFLGVRAAFRQFRSQDREDARGGAIVITGSISGLRGSADLVAYQASKSGILGIVRGAAVYGGPLGIRVNAVAPGIVPTDLFAGDPDTPGGKNDMVRRAATTPLRRAGRAEEIAAVVAFLLGDDAGYLTGEVVSVDGGAAAVSIVRPSGGAGAWDASPLDAQTYGERSGH